MDNLQQLLNSGMASNTIVMVSAADLKAFADRIVADTRRIVEEQYQPRYFDIDDLMKLFKTSRSTIYNWMKKGTLPAPCQLEGKILFGQAEIREAVAHGRVGKYIHK